MTEAEMSDMDRKLTEGRKLLKELRALQDGSKELKDIHSINFLFDKLTFCAVSVSHDGLKDTQRACWDQKIPDLKARILAAISDILDVEIKRITKELADL
jgi:hypothetical protein